MREKPKRRLTQAERSESTRAKILEATIHCLHAYGYTATTTILVAEKAGISRGAMRHQFPTKTDLMLFIVRSVHEQGLALYRERMESGAQQADLFSLSWETMSGPSGVAVLEILQGSRSDLQLRKKLIPLVSQIENSIFRFASGLSKNGGDLHSPAGVRFTLWAFRGLSIAQFLSSPREMKQVLRIMERMYEAFLLTEAKTARSQPRNTRDALRR